MHPSLLQARKAFLLAVQLPDSLQSEVADSLAELGELASSLGCTVVGELVQARSRIDPGGFLGSGKLAEAKAAIKARGADLVLLDANLSPSQSEHLEKALGQIVMDRTQLILELFSHNARTREAQTQVELARLEYMLPRLVGMWAHLDRERGSIGSSRGMGEKQVNIDRSLIRQRIARLKKRLAHIMRERETQKKRRGSCFRVSLAGYTNAGKSTLMNRLTAAAVVAEDRLFATLDSTTRVMSRKQGPPILLSDTVGFLRHLPHGLVASFRSTLEVVRDAHLILHVMDVSHPHFQTRLRTTEAVLDDIGAATVPRLLVFNKIDQVPDKLELAILRKCHPEAVFISALRDDCALLVAEVERFFSKSMITTPLLLEYAEFASLEKLYRWGHVEDLRYEDDGIHLKLTATPANLERLRIRLAI